MHAADVFIWRVRLLLLAAVVALLGLKNPALLPQDQGNESVEAVSHVREITSPVVTVSDIKPLKVVQPAVRSHAGAEPVVRMRSGNAARAVTSMKSNAAKGLTRIACSPARSQSAAARCATARIAKDRTQPAAARMRLAKHPGPGRAAPTVMAKSDSRANARSS
jgi:hypothetical protein